MDHLVINEFMAHPSSGSDWVEIYNPTPDSVNLSGWSLFDNTSSMKSLTGSISPNGFLTFDISNRLNNSGDSILLKDPSGNIVDNYTYNQDPGVDISWGRSPDGGDWTTLTLASKGGPNSPISPSPSPPAPSATTIPTFTTIPASTTPTPSPTPIPTPQPTPTRTPTPTKPPPTPKPPPLQTPTQVPSKPPLTQAPISFPTSTLLSPPKIPSSILSSPSANLATLSGLILGASSQSAQVRSSKESPLNFLAIAGLVFIISGLSFLPRIFRVREFIDKIWDKIDEILH